MVWQRNQSNLRLISLSDDYYTVYAESCHFATIFAGAAEATENRTETAKAVSVRCRQTHAAKRGHAWGERERGIEYPLSHLINAKKA